METAYRSWERRNTRVSGGHGRHKTKVSLGITERRRLLQLLACVLLFLVVFIGKGIFPEQMTSVREGLATLIGGDTDFQAAFASLGRSISAGEPVLDTLGDICVDVFGGSRMTLQPPTESLLPSYEAEFTFLTGRVTAASILERRLGVKAPPEPPPAATVPPQEVVPPAEPLAPAETAPPAEPAITPMEYTGPALPANATMDKYALGLGETVTPVDEWWLSSAFGWREHPVDGEEKFHNGIDMATNDGSAVRAFAAGRVEYIGESPIYGLYTKIQHDNGVTTFYCHCEELLAGQGQTVAAGDIVARSGETGNATGPHLHFELAKDGVLLNPLYYIDQG